MSSPDQRRSAALRGRGQRRDQFGRLLLTTTEARLLNCLLCNQGRVVSKEQIIEWLWGHDVNGGPLYADGILKTRVCWLRALGWPIESAGHRGYIIRWSDEKPVVKIAPVTKDAPQDCIASRVLAKLQANPGQWVRVERHAVQRLRKRGWKIEAEYGKGYRFDPSVTGTLPNPRMATNGHRYARAA